MMKKIIFAIIIFPFLFSCSKNEGCNDIKALNYNIEVDFDDGSCTYSIVTFYADSSRFAGVPINDIEIEIDGKLFDSFSTVYPNGGPSDCDAPGTISFPFQNAGKINWNAIIHLSDGTINTNSGTLEPFTDEQCILISALPLP